MEPRWLDFARRIQAIAQTGLHYEPKAYDREHYEKLREIVAEMLAAGSDAGEPQLLNLLEREKGHATLKVDVRGVVFRAGRILLVREFLDDGRWTLPGGWAEINETPGEATAREVLEESGWHVRTTRLLALYDRRLHGHPPNLFHIYKLFFQCELLNEAPVACRGCGASFRETGEATFFAEEDLPAELSTRRVTRSQLRRFFEMQRNPGLPTDFD